MEVQENLVWMVFGKVREGYEGGMDRVKWIG